MAIRVAVVAFAWLLLLRIPFLAAVRVAFLGWRKQGFAGKPQFAGLLVDLDELHLDLVSFFQVVFHIFYAGVRNFRHVQQAALAVELDKHAVRHDRLDHCAVHIAHFRGEGDPADAVQGGIDGRFIGAGDVDDPFVADFGDIDDRSRFGLDLLDDLPTRADDGADVALVDQDLYDARRMRLVIFAGSGNVFAISFRICTCGPFWPDPKLAP